MKRIIKGISNGLKKLSRKLGRTPTFIFLFAYLFLIVIFSLLYYIFLPGNHFYHPTAQYEYEHFNKDADRILETVREEIIKQFVGEYGSPQTTLNGWQIDIQELDVHSLFIGNFPEEIQFEISLPMTYLIENENYIWSLFTAKVRVPLQSKLIFGNRVLFFVEFLDLLPSRSVKGIPDPPSPEMLFPSWRDKSIKTYTSVLPLSSDEYSSIIKFGQGDKGFPSGISGHYLRMLYFSTGVATSTALGDIVPVTNWARFWVTVESILSIIIITLLLNSIAHDIGKNLISFDDSFHNS